MRHLFSKLLGAMYFLTGAVLLAAGLLVTVPSMLEASSPAAKAMAVALLLASMVPLVAGAGLWKQRPWSRWLFLLAACIAWLPVIMSVPASVELYQHYKQPPPGAYKILSHKEFSELLTQLVLRPLGIAILALVAAAYTFFHFRPLPNPSIERTRPGKPGLASHVKRWASPRRR